MTEVSRHDGGRDFDFLLGSWRVANERLRSRLTGCREWERFETTAEVAPILGGLGNFDRIRAIRNGREFEGCTLRVFNPATGQWTIHWVDTVGYALQPPMVGRFVAGVGEFFGDDEHAGRPVLVRFRWSSDAAGGARWEQAFSPDRGATWETDWLMTLTRRAADEARPT